MKKPPQISGGVRKTVKPTYGYDHRSVLYNVYQFGKGSLVRYKTAYNALHRTVGTPLPGRPEKVSLGTMSPGKVAGMIRQTGERSSPLRCTAYLSARRGGFLYSPDGELYCFAVILLRSDICFASCWRIEYHLSDKKKEKTRYDTSLLFSAAFFVLRN